MLVLSRRRNERLIIEDQNGNRVIVTVTAIGSISAKLGIDAPNSWKIVREELYHGWDLPTDGHS